jgi:predicted DNA-binding transcriptional regulator YafY
VIFQWSAWYVFGFCQQRQDWRLFKLLRLQNLEICDDKYEPREVPPEKREFETPCSSEIQLVALFDESVKYLLIETYGMDCYTETDEGLLFEMSFTSRDFLISWLLGFGARVTVLEPSDIIEGITTAAENILRLYE